MIPPGTSYHANHPLRYKALPSKKEWSIKNSSETRLCPTFSSTGEKTVHNQDMSADHIKFGVGDDHQIG